MFSIVFKKIYTSLSTECSKYWCLASDGGETKTYSCQTSAKFLALHYLCLWSNKTIQASILGNYSNFVYHIIMYFTFHINEVVSIGLGLLFFIPYSSANSDPCFSSPFSLFCLQRSSQHSGSCLKICHTIATSKVMAHTCCWDKCRRKHRSHSDAATSLK